MARNYENKCKQCRREAMKLFLKGDRCHTEKCPVTKKKIIRNRTMKTSDYGIQLREKQKIKRYYGVLERQFRNNFEHATRIRQGLTGENLLILLEKRLDNVVYRMKIGKSRNQARQLVTHGMFMVNDEKVNIPSYVVREGDVITLSPRGAKNKMIAEMCEINQNDKPDVEWLTFDYTGKKGQILRAPQRKDVTMLFNEQLVVELYSK